MKNSKNKKSKKTQDDLLKIISHKDVLLLKKTSTGAVIKVKEQSWLISKTKYTKLDDDLNSTDGVFFGDLKWFYHRFVSKSYVAEENSGKKWTKEEEAILADMIDDDFTIGDISSELKRDLSSIAIKGAKFAKLDFSLISMKNREELHSLRFSEIDF